jgi:hypothetical protein
VPEDTEAGYVFYHDQDAYWMREEIRENKPAEVYLCWAGDGQYICDVLKKHGLRTDWNGSDNQRIRVCVGFDA